MKLGGSNRALPLPMALGLAKEKRVLDIASGEGYGCDLLSSVAVDVTGVDIDHECVDYANAYGTKSLRYRQGDAAKIPLDDDSVDLVIGFETMEHHDQHHEMMAEIRGVLAPEDILCFFTRKEYYSDIPKFQNSYHIRALFWGV